MTDQLSKLPKKKIEIILVFG